MGAGLGMVAGHETALAGEAVDETVRLQEIERAIDGRWRRVPALIAHAVQQLVRRDGFTRAHDQFVDVSPLGRETRTARAAHDLRAFDGRIRLVVNVGMVTHGERALHEQML
jgi:hypothetical protein